MNLTTIQTLKDGTIARSFVHYDSASDAMSALYTTMGYSIANENVIVAVCVIMDDNGVMTKREKWTRPVVPAEPEEQTEEEE